MPTLAWRNDSDGFAFSNSWTFDAAERAALTGAAQSLIPAAIGAVGAVFPALFFDPFLLTGVTAALMTAASYTGVPLPGRIAILGTRPKLAGTFWGMECDSRGARSHDQRFRPPSG